MKVENISIAIGDHFCKVSANMVPYSEKVVYVFCILLTFDKFHLPTTETEWALVGAMLGKNMHPNPSEAMSSSIKGGKMELF